MLTQFITMRSVQSRFAAIYGAKNQEMGLTKAYLRLNFRVASFPAAVRRKDLETAKSLAAQIFAWIAGIANHPDIGIDLYERLLDKFPNACPYCGDSPHTCAVTRPESRLSPEELASLRRGVPEGIDVQLMMHNIYPENALDTSVEHLGAECGELGQELAKESLAGMETELVDMLAHLLAIANLLDFSLLDETLLAFKEGCPSCKGQVCACGEFHQEKVGTRPADPFPG